MSDSAAANAAPTLPDVYYVDRTARGRLRLSGRDRQSFLQGMVSNDVARLAPGEGCYAFQLDPTGHVLADLRVLCADDYLLLDTEPGIAPLVAATLERHLIMERCRIADVTGETTQLFVGGTGAAALLASLFGVSGDPSAWMEGQNAAFSTEDAAGLAAATHLTGEWGADLYLPDEPTLDRITMRLTEAGAVPLGEEALDSLRIEAGIPCFGIDIDARVLAPETGQQARAISYRKGCYIGQEIVARIDARGHTNRVFAGFRLGDGPDLPERDTPITDNDGKEIGRVTSAAIGPRLGVAVALGYLRNEYAAPGTPIRIGDLRGAVAALPFTASEQASPEAGAQ